MDVSDFFDSRPKINRDSYRQKIARRAQPSFLIELPPVEHLVGIHVVPSRHSRDRGSRHQRLFYNRPPLRFRPPLLPKVLLVPHLRSVYASKSALNWSTWSATQK